MARSVHELRIPALEVQQGPKRRLYMFAVDGKLVHSFATVSRIRREGLEVGGYQRPEVLAHINEIRAYIESPEPMIPNAIVLAFDRRVRFESAFGPTSDHIRPGEIVIPAGPFEPESEKPGFVVDGQQRLAAVRDAEVSSFPLCVTAFITDDLKQQTEQFILVNSTKPLPKGLIYELLPNTEARLPSALSKKRFPSELLARLNHDESSPLYRRIYTTTTPEGRIKDRSILRMLDASLSDGLLYRYRDDERNDTQAMYEVLCAFWSAVARVFPQAWDLPPRKSRLVHGVGVIALGHLMDAIGDRRSSRKPTRQDFEKGLAIVEPHCHWTTGYWTFGSKDKRKWNQLQNVTGDIELLTSHLVGIYHQEARRTR